MASNSAVVPAPGNVNDVYGHLLDVLNIPEEARDQSEIWDKLELRLILLNFLTYARDIIDDSDSARKKDKEAYLEAAREASGADPGDVDTIRARARDTLCGFLVDAPWSWMVQGTFETEEINISLKRIEKGIEAALNTLNASLEEDGAESLDYFDDDEIPPPQEDAQTPPQTPKGRRKSSSTVPGSGQGNHGHGKGVPWSDRESLEALRIARDLPGNSQERSAELHTRMSALRTQQGEAHQPARTKNAFRLHLRTLENKTTTIADLERRLGIAGGGGQQG